MSKNTVIVVGFTLFALFFGAGNLIFPLELGWESGSHFNLAIVGFLTSGVGLPLLGMIAGTVEKGGVPNILSKKIHPWFSTLFLIAIYLTIGPFSAIPRTAAFSFEIGMIPLINDNSPLYLLLFTGLYFLTVLYISINPLKMVDWIGKLLTPLLLLSILALCGVACFTFKTPISNLNGNYINNNAFSEGFIQGFMTMDILAAIAFSIIVINAFKSAKIRDNQTLIRYCIYSSLIAGLGLAIVYLSLAWIGNHYSPLTKETYQLLIFNERNVGAYLLGQANNTLFGQTGPILMAIIILLACLTTATGLIVAVSGFFHQILQNKFPKITYKIYVYLFTFISFILANQGLNQVIATAKPVMIILYPIAIITTLIIFINKWVTIIPKLTVRLAVSVAMLITIITITNKELTISLRNTIINSINEIFYTSINLSHILLTLDFLWIIPTVIFGIMGFIIAKLFKLTE